MNNTLTIIIADDDSDDQEFLENTIREINSNVKILPLSDGKELMDIFWGKKQTPDPAFLQPDLIFLDLNMPLMGGYEVLKFMREDAALKSIPVFILTTSEFEYDKIKSIAYGANDFYSKPMTLKELKKIVMEIFSRHFQLALSE